MALKMDSAPASPEVSATQAAKPQQECKEGEVMVSHGKIGRRVDNIKTTTTELLERVKDLSPALLKSAIETVEKVSNPIVSTVDARMLEPIVGAVDSRIESAILSGKSLLGVQPEDEVSLKDVEKKVHETLDFDEDGIVTLNDFVGHGSSAVHSVTDVVSKAKNSAVSKVKNTTLGYWETLLWYSQNTFDRLPFMAADNEQEIAALEAQDPKQPFTMQRLSSHVATRLSNKANKGVSGIRAFSKERLSKIIHVDLIEYAEVVIDKTSASIEQTTTPAYEQTRTQLAEAVATLKAKLDAAKEAAAHAAAEASNKALQTSVGSQAAGATTRATSAVSAFGSQLRLRLALASRAAKEVTRYSGSYLLGRQVTKFPHDLRLLLLHCVGMDKEDREAFTEWDKRLYELATALVEVLVWRGEWKKDDGAAAAVEGSGPVQGSSGEADDAAADKAAMVYAVRLSVMGTRDFACPAGSEPVVTVALSPSGNSVEESFTTPVAEQPELPVWNAPHTFQCDEQPRIAHFAVWDSASKAQTPLGEVRVDLTSYFGESKKAKAFQSWRKLKTPGKTASFLQIQVQCNSQPNAVVTV